MIYKKLIIIFMSIFFISCTSLEKKVEISQINRNLQRKELTKKIEKDLKIDLNRGKNQLMHIKSDTKIETNKKIIKENNLLEVYDPLEPLNRRIYYFNYGLDKYLLMPVVNTYNFITPHPVKKGVSNFFTNLQGVNTFINSILQIKLKKSGITLMRFGINSTVGILGVVDVASLIKIPKTYENFGKTLLKYGVKAGPYLVLPGLGPSNLRDSTGKIIDSAIIGIINPYNNEIGIDVNSLEYYAANSINSRYKLIKFRYYNTGSPLEYEYVRYVFSKYQEILSQIEN